MIEVEARITGRVGERAFRAELPNGKEVIAHPSKRPEPVELDLNEGDLVRLAMSPFDFSSGRILELLSGGETGETGESGRE